MPSPLTVPVALVDKILPHPNADRLEIAHVLGWQCIVGKGQFAEGDKVVYFPPDTVLSKDLSDELGVTQYLQNGRLRACRLRGEKSFGLVVKPKEESWGVGDNVAHLYDVKKYEPVESPAQRRAKARGASLAELAGFPKYTHIDNARHHPLLIDEDELVIVTEKIHGTNSRVGKLGRQWMAGSHNVRRRRPYGFLVHGEVDSWWKKVLRWIGHKLGLLKKHETDKPDLYWHPLSLPSVVNMIQELAKTYSSVVVYGELYGPGIQKLTYGIPEGEIGYAAFDIKVDGAYLNMDRFLMLCCKYEVPYVPVIYAGARKNVNLANISEGLTTIMGTDAHMREGVVVKPQTERTDPRIGRVILKYVSDTYLLSKVED